MANHRTQEIKFTAVQILDDGDPYWELVDILKADEESPSFKTLSDRDWFTEEISNVGLETLTGLGEESPRDLSTTLVEVAGYLTSSSGNYYVVSDVDVEFVITEMKKLKT